MWPFKKKTGSLHYDCDQYKTLFEIISGLEDLEVLREDMYVVGVVDMVTIEYKVGDELLDVCVENISGIDVTGSISVIAFIDSEMSKLSS